jgi:hypothetical protein
MGQMSLWFAAGLSQKQVLVGPAQVSVDGVWNRSNDPLRAMQPVGRWLV